MTSEELRAVHRGDERFFEKAVRAHSGRLITYLRGYVDDDATAEDLAQEAWVRAYRRRASFRAEGSFVGWLLAVGRSTALDHLRSNRRSPVQEDSARLQTMAADGARSPLERLVSADRAQQLRAALLELPERQRDTVVLRLIEDHSVRATAAAMGCAEGTVKAALSQALKNLREILRGDTEIP